MEKRAKTKILYLTTVAQSMVRFLTSEIRMMVRKGFDVHCACSPELDFAESLAQLPAKVYHVKMRRRIAPFFDIISLIKIYRLVSQIRPDILVVSTPKASFLGLISGTMVGTPIRVYVVRGNLTETLTGIGRVILIACEWLNCRLSHAIRPVSFSILSSLKDRKLAKPQKLAVLGKGGGPGIDDKLFCPLEPNNSKVADLRHRLNLPRRCNVIGFVGRLAKDKGINELAWAWRVIRNEHDDALLLLVGGVDESDLPCKDVLRELQIDRRVLLSGAVQFDEMPYFYSLMDVVVVPTYREGFPNVVLEAGAMEKPIIGTKVTGCVDAIDDGVTGVLVPPRDSDALANAIQNYINSPELKEKHGKAAREKVSRFYTEKIISEARLEDYCRLLDQKGLWFSKKNPS